jgi:hypothetical protein
MVTRSNWPEMPGGRVVDVEQPAGRVVLQPFPDVPLVRAGPLREFRRGRRAVRGQGPVQAKPLAQVHGEELQRPGNVMEQPFGERGGWAGGAGRSAVRRHAAQRTATWRGQKDTAME